MFVWKATLAAKTFTTQEDLAALGLGQEFSNQHDAEEWLGEYFAELSDLDVTEVSLYSGDELVLGPMSLEA